MKNAFKSVKSELKKLLTKDIMVYFVLLQIIGLFFIASIYVNRVGNAYPVTVVDQENNSISRMIISYLDSSPELKVTLVSHTLEVAMNEMKAGRTNAVVFIPKGFYSKALKKKLPHVKIFVDSRNLIVANSVFTGLKKTIGTLLVGSKLKMMQKYFPVPDRLIKIIPIKLSGKPIGNAELDYFHFMLIMYFIMIIQQSLLVGSSLGLARESEFCTLKSSITNAGGHIKYLLYRLMAIMTIQSVLLILSSYIFYGVLGIHSQNLLWSMVYLFMFSVATTSFSQFLGLFFSKRIHVLQILVFISIPSLLASGYIYPHENFPDSLRYFSYLLPSTPILNSFPRLTTLSGSVPYLWHYMFHLISLSIFYFIISILFLKTKSSNSFSLLKKKMKTVFCQPKA